MWFPWTLQVLALTLVKRSRAVPPTRPYVVLIFLSLGQFIVQPTIVLTTVLALLHKLCSCCTTTAQQRSRCERKPVVLPALGLSTQFRFSPMDKILRRTGRTDSETMPPSPPLCPVFLPPSSYLAGRSLTTTALRGQWRKNEEGGEKAGRSRRRRRRRRRLGYK